MTPTEIAIWSSAYGCAFVAVMTRLPNPSDPAGQQEAAIFAKSVAEAALGLSGKAETRVVLATEIPAK